MKRRFAILLTIMFSLTMVAQPSLTITNVIITTVNSNSIVSIVQFNKVPDFLTVDTNGYMASCPQMGIERDDTTYAVTQNFVPPGVDFSKHTDHMRTNQLMYWVRREFPSTNYIITGTNKYELNLAKTDFILPWDYTFVAGNNYSYLIYLVQYGKYVSTNSGVTKAVVWNFITPAKNLRHEKY